MRARPLHLAFLLLAHALVVASCGGRTLSGPSSFGDCTTDADCDGGICAPITPGGYRICLNVPPEATSCPGPTPATQCCTTADCMGKGTCYANPVPCGASPMEVRFNECLADACETDADCGPPPGVCAPAGAYGNPVRGCITAHCKTDADCTSQAYGFCAPVVDACCTAAALACVYPGGCQRDADCPQGYCAITSGAGVCVAGLAACAD